MFNSSILDVVIGLIFVYSLLSLVCTAINEIIEARLKMRAVDLERGIREMLNDEDYDLVRRLYNHPLIYSLFQGRYDEAKKTGTLPSYIPARNFALALMDMVLPAEPSSARNPARASGAAGATAPMSGNKVTGANKTSPLSDLQIKALRDAIGVFAADEKVKQALMTLVDAAGGDIGQARKNIEDRFDSTMDRVSGWYKRRVQWVTLFVALLIAVGLNADTIAIGDSLSYGSAQRDALVAAAQEYAKSNPSESISQNAESSIEACKKDENSPECRVAKNLNEIHKLGLPIGWNFDDPTTLPNTWQDWLIKGLGWLLTAFAISLGAPFWFDMLNKVMVVRSTVRPKEKSPEEPPVNR